MGAAMMGAAAPRRKPRRRPHALLLARPVPRLAATAAAPPPPQPDPVEAGLARGDRWKVVALAALRPVLQRWRCCSTSTASAAVGP